MDKIGIGIIGARFAADLHAQALEQAARGQVRDRGGLLEDQGERRGVRQDVQASRTSTPITGRCWSARTSGS